MFLVTTNTACALIQVGTLAVPDRFEGPLEVLCIAGFLTSHCHPSPPGLSQSPRLPLSFPVITFTAMTRLPLTSHVILREALT